MERVFREACSSEPVLADFLQVLRTVEEQLALGYRKGEGAARGDLQIRHFYQGVKEVHRDNDARMERNRQ